MAEKRICSSCNKTQVKGHFNKKYCEPCRRKLRSKPRGSMTKEQIAFAKKNRNKMKREDICKKLGVSLSNLKRSCININFEYIHHRKNKYITNPKLVEKVLRCYEKHGKKKTQEKFPDVRIRSVVERYKDYLPRQEKWSDKQLIELTQMAGLVSFKSQARYFSRPNANEGSIKSVWVKKFKTSQENINGMAYHKAKHFVNKKAPFINTSFGSGSGNAKRLLLWVDFEKHINFDAPSFIKEAVSLMAEFQRKLFKVKDVREKIIQMMKERELS